MLLWERQISVQTGMLTTIQGMDPTRDIGTASIRIYGLLSQNKPKHRTQSWMDWEVKVGQELGCKHDTNTLYRTLKKLLKLFIKIIIQTNK